MTREEFLQYLDKQLERLQAKELDPDVFRTSILAYLDRFVDLHPSIRKQFDALVPEMTISLEALYPEKIVDRVKTISKYQSILDVARRKASELPEEQLFQADAKASDVDLAVSNAARDAVLNQLTGAQIKAFRQIIKDSKEDELVQTLTEKIKALDIEVTNQLLIEIFACKELWESLD